MEAGIRLEGKTEKTHEGGLQQGSLKNVSKREQWLQIGWHIVLSRPIPRSVRIGRGDDDDFVSCKQNNCVNNAHLCKRNTSSLKIFSK